MILGFQNRLTEDIFNGDDTKAARSIPRTISKVANRKLDMINASRDVQDLKVPPGNRLEMLKGERKGWYSIRINDPYRIVFHWEVGNAKDVGITDYH